MSNMASTYRFGGWRKSLACADQLERSIFFKPIVENGDNALSKERKGMADFVYPLWKTLQFIIMAGGCFLWPSLVFLSHPPVFCGP